MNCKFCGNFVPNGSESCPVCGRRSDERPIAELLAEGKAPAAPVVTEDDTDSKKTLRTSLVLPTLLILLSFVGWVYIVSSGLIGNIMTSIREVTGGNTGISSGSEFETGSAVVEGNLAATGLGVTGAVIVGIVSLMLVVGVIMFFVRLVNRIRVSAKKDD